MLALVCQDFYSLLHYLGYEKILGLRGDRTKKRSLEARAEGFLALKKSEIFLLTDINVPLVTALMIEKMTHKKWISWHMCRVFHWINMGTVLLMPVYVINFKYEHIGPGN